MGCTGKIVQADYAGVVTATREGYPGVENLLLSADGQRLFAAWPGGHAIVALDAANLSEVARYEVGADVSPHTLAAAGDRIWFGYQAASDEGGIGSLDLRGESPAVTLDDGAEKWADAPRLATAANRPASTSGPSRPSSR
ncbi:hypothetical protein [Winogradskya humida]|uniref:Uncharacterized protein n=1 Tax=Winogradskya humida TaxID=113566 RepID=A0ABQ3ZTS5_9ACTN|nr:hypothetical protein [Actinoplanes humidus]GIE21963.1 hypothetical protein Ahu01nite_050650 [Actinoplanes humidus]